MNLAPQTEAEIERRRIARVEIRTKQCRNLVQHGFKVEFVTDGHVIIDGRLDLYLAHGKWRDKTSGKEGRFYRVRDVIGEVFPREGRA